LGGFTLTEIAIVLFIISLLLGSMMLPLSAQIDNRDNAAAQTVLGEIRDAMIGYAASHTAADARPYLPCPDTNDDGVENRNVATGACTSAEGRIPWATLGLGRLDPWNNRYRYRVAPGFSNSSAGFQLTTVGNLRVCSDNGCGTIIANQLPAVVLSHGKNGFGAFNSSGGTNAVSSNDNEKQNSNGDNDFVSKESDPNFDDIVIWLSPNILFNRMVAAGRLP
jgi:type II secretory pathway pseudopilin PulG